MAATLPCSRCGYLGQPGNQFCPNCGAPIVTGPTTWAPPAIPPFPLRPPKPHETSNEVVLIIIVIIVAIGALAGVGAVMLGRQSAPTITPPSSMGVFLARSADGTNWTLTFTLVPTGLTTSVAKLTIMSTGGSTALAATSFSGLSYPIDRVAYVQALAGSSVRVGDRILVSTTTYPTGYQYQISDGTRILAAGILQG